eukprot:TRINITY_DN21145_c0_g1_i1.p1 TRINITY_DN21145_c0_g1~~TRINITY_DN21145_c0_g1_i1.p1  ORF type:complete len:695 (+),score=114.43 TRINITY_DN21145_c0_g1_i1:75-2087(+)
MARQHFTGTPGTPVRSVAEVPTPSASGPRMPLSIGLGSTLQRAIVKITSPRSKRASAKRRGSVHTPQGLAPQESASAARLRAWNDHNAAVEAYSRERMRHRDRCSALDEVRGVAAQMRTMKPHQLSNTTLGGWADRIDTYIQQLEDLLPEPPTPPDESPAPMPADLAPSPSVLSDTGDSARRLVSRLRTGTAPTPIRGPASKMPTVSPMSPPVPAPGAAPGLSSVDACCAAACHLTLETLAVALRAERATLWVWIPRLECLQGVVQVGKASSDSLRCPAGKGWPGQVFGVGIGANVAHTGGPAGGSKGLAGRDSPKKSQQHDHRARSVLCLPLPATDGCGPGRLGVVELLNKDRGAGSFTAADESALAAALPFFSYALQHYPTDAQRWHFDAANLLHTQRPWRPQQDSTKASRGAEGQRLLVYRTAGSALLLRRIRGEAEQQLQAAPVDSPRHLIEVDSYMERLEESWRNCVLLVCSYQDHAASASDSFKELRERVRVQARELERKREEGAARDAICEEFRRSYDRIAGELREVLCSGSQGRLIETILEEPSGPSPTEAAPPPAAPSCGVSGTPWTPFRSSIATSGGAMCPPSPPGPRPAWKRPATGRSAPQSARSAPHAQPLPPSAVPPIAPRPLGRRHMQAPRSADAARAGRQERECPYSGSSCALPL